MKLDKATVLKFDVPGPRYTSYPTAPIWNQEFGEVAYHQKLQAFGQTDKTLSLYIHIPFCESLCYFCACNMMIRRQDDKVGNQYLDYLDKEIDLITARIGKKAHVKQLHWGGGTPTFLTNAQITRLFNKLQSAFDIDLNGEVAIEIDPRTIDQSKLTTLRHLGFNRVSMGIQDFDSDVQTSVNRVQPLAMIERVVGWCRELKFGSMNFDLIYGLPHQTINTFSNTIKKTIQFKPDRIALYSFAYLPWMKKHGSKIEEDHLPSSDDKLDIFLQARDTLIKSGYKAIAMDHFALESDELGKAFDENRLYRNFMGYTVKPADEYIGLGVSAIGFLQQSFMQNTKLINEYYEILDQGHLPIERGKDLSVDDLMRQWVIKELMCHFRVNKAQFESTFAQCFDNYFSEEQLHIANCIEDGLLNQVGDQLNVTELGKIFIRNICMGFDWYLRQKGSHTKFSKTV